MPVLPSTERVAAMGDAMRENQQPWPGACLKGDLRTAVNNLDDLLESNATAINNAFPASIRAQLTTQQKARLVLAVIRRRYLLS